MLQSLVTAYEKVLLELDMSLNAGKSCCICIGPRYDKIRTNILRLTLTSISGLSELHYLGTFIVSTHNFKISLHDAQRSFFQVANAIFGKVGRIASKNEMLADTDVLFGSL